MIKPFKVFQSVKKAQILKVIQFISVWYGLIRFNVVLTFYFRFLLLGVDVR